MRARRPQEPSTIARRKALRRVLEAIRTKSQSVWMPAWWVRKGWPAASDAESWQLAEIDGWTYMGTHGDYPDEEVCAVRQVVAPKPETVVRLV
jgi:hypothetical protein